MYYEDNSQALNFLTGLALGVVIGAGVALLAAPQSGRRTRKRIRRAADDVRDTASETFEELGDDLKSAVGAGRRRLPL